VTRRKWGNVRIAAELIPPLDILVEKAKDEFGVPLFKSKSEAVTEAVREYLRKNLPKEDKPLDQSK